MAMEDSIGKFCRTVAKFCNHLQTSCTALKESVDRRPIPLDSASTTFVQSVNRRVSAAGDDLNMLEAMSFATVSFEELLGHCNEVLKKNQNDICSLQDHLRSSSNYILPRFYFLLLADFEEDDVVNDFALDNVSLGSDSLELKSDVADEDPFRLDDSLSLKNFGISDVCLATIASEADDKFEMDEPDFHIAVALGPLKRTSGHSNSAVYNIDLLIAVEKMNSHIGTKKTKKNSFQQDDIELLGLGQKARSYLLLLIKMNQLSIETNEVTDTGDGSCGFS
ncbi:hypothetical protein Sango_1497900 [Sesamum angolense]|uniref:Spindle and kinetochore-associated protein 3 n=1 Tax=Sesamum angolense TaxID=2727404 RepID=A0AAE1WNY4_9LAMI|nr:hypothetical protein Sango_1497900 [Sesamum angolense]